MAKKKPEAEAVDASLNIESLMKGVDGASVLANNNMLTMRPKIRSKIEILNCMLGGGRPYGSITGSFGPPAGGKSTEAYQSAAEFLAAEPTGVVIILDQESSADPNRLEYLGINLSRVIRLQTPDIDTGFTSLIHIIDTTVQKQKLAGRRIPLFVVWDTISKGRAEANETASRMDAMNRARIIKSRMSDLAPWLDRLDVILILLNQVIFETDKYGNVTLKAGGGVALKHDEHLRLLLEKKETKYNDLTGLAESDLTELTIDKTKLSPKMRGIPVIFDVLNGGIINEEASFLKYFENCKLLVSSGGWWHINEIISLSEGRFYSQFLAQFAGNKRKDTFIELLKTNRALYIALRLFFLDTINEAYSLQKIVTVPYYEQLQQEFLALTATGS